MIIQGLPYIPIDIDNDNESVKFLNSLEGRLTKIDAVRAEGNSLHVLGLKENYLKPKLYFIIEQNRQTGRINEANFTEPDTFIDFVASIFTLGLY